MKFNGSKFRSSDWIWNLGIVVLAILMIFMLARQPVEELDDKIAFVCKGLKQGTGRAAVQKCIEDMNK